MRWHLSGMFWMYFRIQGLLHRFAWRVDEIGSMDRVVCSVLYYTIELAWAGYTPVANYYSTLGYSQLTHIIIASNYSYYSTLVGSRPQLTQPLLSSPEHIGVQPGRQPFTQVLAKVPLISMISVSLYLMFKPTLAGYIVMYPEFDSVNCANVIHQCPHLPKASQSTPPATVPTNKVWLEISVQILGVFMGVSWIFNACKQY